MNRAMPERRWRINRLGRGLFEIAVDDGEAFRPATTEEVDTALRQREVVRRGGIPGRLCGRENTSGAEPQSMTEEDRSVDGVLVRTPAGMLAQRHHLCVQPDDQIEAKPIIVNIAEPEETRRCSTCGALIPWSP